MNLLRKTDPSQPNLEDVLRLMVGILIALIAVSFLIWPFTVVVLIGFWRMPW
jgi:hypothetical protein